MKRGINMILTPQFTPPLDTGVGYERTTVQLVEVFKEADGWRFDFKNLRRFSQSLSIKSSQSGSQAVSTPNTSKRLFGMPPIQVLSVIR